MIQPERRIFRSAHPASCILLSQQIEPSGKAPNSPQETALTVEALNFCVNVKLALLFLF